MARGSRAARVNVKTRGSRSLIASFPGIAKIVLISIHVHHVTGA